MQPNFSINFSNFSTYQPTETITEYCIQGVNNTQTTIIIVLNIVIFIYLYLVMVKHEKTKKDTFLRIIYFSMTFLNAILLYYWIIA